nr:anthranilate phosphoribosyltransferase [Chloroflexota bacterium]
AFNLLGPLCNPAGVRRQVVGCAEPAAAHRLAAALQALGAVRASVVHGDGLDELPLDGSGIIHDVTPDAIRRRRVHLEPLGLHEAAVVELAGGSAEENGRLIEQVLRGSRGPRRDVVLLNAAAALSVAGRTRTLAAGVALAARTIDSGAGMDLLARLRARAAAPAMVEPSGPAGPSGHEATR